MRIFHNPPEHRLLELLANCDLPTSDLKSHHFENFLGCGTAEDLKGIVGLELFDSIALLRSLAVAEEVRGSGCGKALVKEVENYAIEKGVRKLYLLTTTAEGFFARLGYTLADRNGAPEEIKSTKEFSGLCPDSAAFMAKKL